MKRIIHWFRRDLRITDNTSLSQAIQDSDDVVPVFILDPAFLQSKSMGSPRLQFILDSLKSLQANLREKGLSLVIVKGSPEACMIQLCKETGADHVYCNKNYEPEEVERDARVLKTLKGNGFHLTTFKDAVVWEENEILTGRNQPYTVFTPYSKNWKTRRPPDPLPSLKMQKISDLKLVSIRPIPLPETLTSWGYDPFKLPFPGGEREGLKALKSFIKSGVHDYKTARDFPSISGTSKLSAHLNWGTVSIRTILKALNSSPASTSSGALAFQNELIWREFFIQILSHFPHVTEGAFRSELNDLNWLNYAHEFEAWREGRTGYSIVDAAMRCLNKTGWMHNRLRMITAMFLTKDLMINWQWGEQYFMEKLADADLAANNGGWQWSAGTGTDAAPYFRIFNPISQGEKFDAQGDFVKTWVPELRNFPDSTLHQPWKDPLLLRQSGYVERIALHEDRRSRCLEMYKKVKSES